MNETKFVYRSVEGLELEGLLYKPDGPPPYDLVIEVHGGAWSSGHYESGRYYDTKLAEAGICVFAINFRNGPDFSHPLASSDIAAAIRFAKSSLGIEYKQIGLVGSSSGGHLALYTSLLPNVAAHQDDSTDISAEVDFVIGSDEKADILFDARYPALRFKATNSAFALSGFRLEYAPSGGF